MFHSYVGRFSGGPKIRNQLTSIAGRMSPGSLVSTNIPCAYRVQVSTGMERACDNFALKPPFALASPQTRPKASSKASEPALGQTRRPPQGGRTGARPTPNTTASRFRGSEPLPRKGAGASAQFQHRATALTNDRAPATPRPEQSRRSTPLAAMPGCAAFAARSASVAATATLADASAHWDLAPYDQARSPVATKRGAPGRVSLDGKHIDYVQHLKTLI